MGLPLDQLRQNTKFAVDNVVQTIIADPIQLAEMVAGGFAHFRASAHRVFNEYAKQGVIGTIDDTVVYAMFGQLCQAYAIQNPDMTAGQFLDSVEPETGPTQAEIDKAWEIEVASDERAVKEQYGRNHPQDVLDKYIQGATPKDIIH